MENEKILSPDTDTADTESELETSHRHSIQDQPMFNPSLIITSNEKTISADIDTADTESEVETNRQIHHELDSSKIIIHSNEMIVPSIVQLMRDKNPNIAIHYGSPIKSMRKPFKISSKKSASKVLARAKTDKKTKILKPKKSAKLKKENFARKPDKTSKSVLEKTCTFTSKSIKTQFSTRTSDELEQEIADHSTSIDEFGMELSEPSQSNRESQQNLETYSEFPSSSHRRTRIQISDDEITTREAAIAKVPTVVHNNSNNMATTSGTSDKLILAKIDMLQRVVNKGFSKMTKSEDNNYNDIKSLIPTHSVAEFDSLDVILREDNYLLQKMRRYLQRYRAVATTNDIYGSVLNRIVDDKVLLSYNFNGVKKKFKINDYAVIEILFDIYKPADRIVFEKNLKLTIEFAKNRHYNNENQKKKRLQQ